MMKKLISVITTVLLSLCLCIGLVACGGGGGTHEGDHNTDDPYESTGEYHTVTFDSQGGSEVEAQTVLDGDYARQPSRPEKAGSYFLHWSEEIEGERFVFTSRIITKDMTLYAVWGEAYTVTFDTQGGSDIPAQYVSPNTSARNPDSPKREGYNFLGWYTEAEGGVEWKWNDPVTGNITVYAHWESDSETEATASLEYTYDSTLGGYVVTGVGQEADIRIPAEYNGTRGLHPVVGIGDRAFYNERITSVELPASLVSIGGQAFTRTDLVTVTIPASVTSLGNYAFSECKSLTSVTFEAGSRLESIGQRAFADDPALLELTIPASVTSIGNYLIRNSGVTTIHFLGTRAAWDAIDKAENWNYGNTDVEVICSDGSVSEPTDPEPDPEPEPDPDPQPEPDPDPEPTDPTPTDPEPSEPTDPEPTEPTPTDPDPTASLQFKRSGDGYVVTGENQNASVIVIPAVYADLPVIGIDERAFAYSNHISPITSVTIPDSVTEIGQNAFYNQHYLEEVHIGESSHLEKIGSNAFSGCSALKSFYLPAGCVSLGYDANEPHFTVTDPDYIESFGAVFNNCGALNGFTVAAENPSFASMGGHLVYIGEAHNTSGAVILVRGVNAPVIPSGVTEIGEAAFRDATISSITIPATVTKIGKYAFERCAALAEINFLGTSAQWEAVEKGSDWNYGTAVDFTVRCSDDNA